MLEFIPVAGEKEVESALDSSFYKELPSSAYKWEANEADGVTLDSDDKKSK